MSAFQFSSMGDEGIIMNMMEKETSHDSVKEVEYHRQKNRNLESLVKSLEIKSSDLVSIDGVSLEKSFRNGQKVLGEGGFGSVTLNRWIGKGGGRVVAVKNFDVDSKNDPDDVLGEFEIILSLFHPNVARVFGYYKENTHCGIVMEKCDDDVLSKVDRTFSKKKRKKKKSEPVTNKESSVQFWKLIVLRDMAISLNYLHSIGVVHRDIKPANFLIDDVKDKGTANTRVKITDFGLSRVLDDKITHETLESGQGTESFLAPELVFAQKDRKGVPYSFSSDIFALGFTFHYVMFYCLPKIQTKANSEGELFQYFVTEDGYVPEISALIKKMLIYQRKKRITIGQVLAEIEEMLKNNEYRVKMEGLNWKN